MINLKRIGIVLGISAIAAMMFTNTVLAEGDDENSEAIKHTNTTFIDQDNYISDEEEIKALKACNIKNFDNKSENSVFSDESTKNDIKYKSKLGYKIIDLAKMADKMRDGLLVDMATDGVGKDEVFNNGVLIIRSYEDDSFGRYICKCNESEFDGFFEEYNYIYWEEQGEDTYTCTMEDSDGRIERQYELTYDREKEILNFSYAFY